MPSHIPTFGLITFSCLVVLNRGGARRLKGADAQRDTLIWLDRGGVRRLKGAEAQPYTRIWLDSILMSC